MTQAYDRVCRKIYTNLMIFEPFKSQSIRKSAYVNSCLFSTSNDNQSPRSRKKFQVLTLYSGRHIGPYWCTTDVHQHLFYFIILFYFFSFASTQE